MSAIDPRVRFAVPDFLRSLATVRLGESQPTAGLEHPKMMAVTVLHLIVGGDESQLDLGDLALSDLARATISLCDNPLDQAAIAEFQRAADAWNEVNQPRI